MYKGGFMTTAELVEFKKYCTKRSMVNSGLSEESLQTISLSDAKALIDKILPIIDEGVEHILKPER